VDLELRQASISDVDVVVELLSAAARWMLDAGIRQWPDPFPREIVEASIERRETYLAFTRGQMVGSIALYEEDPNWWGDRPPDALYVHRLVVALAARGQNIGVQLLDWAQRQVAAAGRAWLRLDCGTENLRMRKYYEDLGFSHVQDVVVSLLGAGSDRGAWRGSLYERAISTTA
jgi:ribosomal protein S18 acetylase RimI-like enzyme